MSAAEVAEEGHEEQARHVESGQEGHEQADAEQHRLARAQRSQQDLVLAVVAGEGRDPRDGQGADQEGPEGHRYLAAQPAHLPHVLLPGHGVDHRARAEEQQRLEEGVGEEVEHRHPERAHAAGQEHVAELADRRVGQDLLDVGLDEGHGGPQERGGGTDDRHHPHGRLGHVVERGQARHQVDAGGDHGGGVDQGGDRGRTLHRIGQPDVEGDLGALAAGSHEKEEAGDGGGPEGAPGLVRQGPGIGRDVHEVERAELMEDEDHPQDQPRVADPVHHEGLHAGGRGRVLLVPEPDEQVGAEPHPLPSHEEEGKAAAQDEQQHEEREQVQVGEEAGTVVVVGHVAQRVDVDERADARHHQDHDRGKRIEEQAQGDAEAARLDPLEAHVGLLEGHAVRYARQAVEAERRPGREAKGGKDGEAGEIAGPRVLLFLVHPRPRQRAFGPVPEKGEDHEAREREQEDDEGQGVESEELVAYEVGGQVEHAYHFIRLKESTSRVSWCR